MNLESLLKLKLHRNKCKAEVAQTFICLVITWIANFKDEKNDT